MASRRCSYFMRADEVLDAIFEDDELNRSDNSEDEEIDGVVSYPSGEILSEVALELEDTITDSESPEHVPVGASDRPSETFPTHSSASMRSPPSLPINSSPLSVSVDSDISSFTASPLPPMNTYQLDQWSTGDTLRLSWNFDESCVGPLNPPSPGSKAIEYFERFFTQQMWDLLVLETNRYADQVRQQILSPQARPWHCVTHDEMKAFIGLLIAMGVLKLPRLRMYWQQSYKMFGTTGIAEIISNNRFEQIWRFFHLSNNDDHIPVGQSGHDKLFKARKFLDLILPTFESEYNLPQQITIDEAMIPFKGRIGFIQYMKDKPTKWGIKVFTLSDASTGYIYRLNVYTGKSSVESDCATFGLSFRAVTHLMEGLDNRGHQLYTDNYYTSPNLYVHLYEKGTMACGTVRPNRKGFPKALVKKGKQARGFYDYRTNGPLLACAWYDRRMVYLLTTIHVAETTDGPTTVSRRVEKGVRTDVPCPPAVIDYIKYMRGVDRADQLIELYNAGRKSRKWWKRLFFHLLECSILNAHIIYKSVSTSQASSAVHDLLQFRLELAEQLVGGKSFRIRRCRSLLTSEREDRLNSSLDHLPEVVDCTLQCIVCAKYGEIKKLSRSEYRHRTNIVCSHCRVHLCLHKERNCFQKFHKLQNYWSN